MLPGRVQVPVETAHGPERVSSEAGDHSTHEDADESVRLHPSTARIRHDTPLARATCGSIRLKLLKIGVQFRLSARRIRVAMASGCPHATEFTCANARLCG